VPNGITHILIEVWGAGGGGGPSCPPDLAGGGGAGGYTRALLTVTPGATFNIVVGTGGSGGLGGFAEPSSFQVTMVALHKSLEARRQCVS
jgi:hypothetical protein